VLIKALVRCVGERVDARNAGAQATAAGPSRTPYQEPPAAVRPPEPPVTPPPQRLMSSGPTPGPEPAVSNGLKIGICIATILVPLVGLIMGGIYMKDANPEKKAVGKLWLFVGIGAALFFCLISTALRNS